MLKDEFEKSFRVRLRTVSFFRQYWKATDESKEQVIQLALRALEAAQQSVQADVCHSCGASYALHAQYCYQCGTRR